MTWKCAKCGFSANVDGAAMCSGCGDVRLGRLVLVSEETGQQIVMSVDTTVGRGLLRTFAGDDARYAAEPQFRVTRDVAVGKWTASPAAGTKNATCVDGVPLGDAPVPLGEGSVISIGPDKMRLAVKIEF
ncbi:MAG TPA: FHA domain-containing protein [Phycisphaerae bacterium]|nr:FHA domain-containing protein [Phycisphaerae bacterium]HOI54326.1 FHA domain-containing protein [Phycisphaerae bacterium]